MEWQTGDKTRTTSESSVLSEDLSVYGRVSHKNPNLYNLNEDVLYHFALDTENHDLKSMFGDVKFVVCGGSPRRMEIFAHYMLKELKLKLPAGQTLMNIAGATDRYALYKAGPVLSASHGIGFPSFSIMMHELIKLLYYAEAKDVTFFRIGTSGGLGMDAGSVIISDSTVDGLYQPALNLPVLGKMVSRPAVLDAQLAHDLADCAETSDGFQVYMGTTMCTLDFYEGQGRLDGAFCDYRMEDKMQFLQDAHDKGIRNIEMESLCFAAMCNQADIKGAVACVTILNRLQGDQVTASIETLKEWGQRPAKLVARYIKKVLNDKNGTLSELNQVR